MTHYHCHKSNSYSHAPSTQHPAPSTQHPAAGKGKLSLNRFQSLGQGIGYLLLSSILIYACQKDVNETASQPPISITRLVQDFINGAESNTQIKSLESLTVDSAVWYIEAALNLDMTQSWLATNERISDSVEVAIPTVDGMVQEVDAFNAFAALKESIEARQLEDPIIIIDLVESVMAESVLLKAYYSVALPDPKTLNSSFGSNDYFYWGGSISNCGCGPNLNGIGSCANIQIQNRLNGALPPLEVGQYFTNVVTIQDFQYSSYWSCSGSSCTPSNECFSPTMLSNYTNAYWGRFNALNPVKKTKVGAQIEAIWLLCCPTSKSHLGSYTYGNKQSGPNS